MGCSYFECSAKENLGIKEIFMNSLKMSMNQIRQNMGE